MLLCSPAGNDLLFDESLCEQGRNFNNKIWNAFRLIKGWTIVEIEQPMASAKAVKWFESQLNKSLAEIDDLFAKYRLSEALMVAYKLFWDEFASWFLEIIKPAYQEPIDKISYEAAIHFFETLLKILHPFIPFITEELWQNLTERKEGESIMIQLFPQAGKIDETLLENFESTKQIIANIRAIRLQKNIPNKKPLKLQIVGKSHPYFDSIIEKLGNLDAIETVSEKSAEAASFLVGTTEFAIPLAGFINVEEEIKKIQKEIDYLEGFLASVTKKLNNQNFLSHAKPEIVESEKKKQSDTEKKLSSLRETLAGLMNS
ncbi:MAG TPA: class I tRNA ligase family protein, partial [Paludibacteraceae bacterium]|nr:class I tRNA ligase family protein [Paludibacteraceae bacterium]